MLADVILSIVVVLLVIVWSMRLIPISFKIILTLTALILLLNYFGLLYGLNEPANNLFAGMPDKSCKYDNDCTVTQTHCNPCDCGQAVNKVWEKVCIFKDVNNYDCKSCPQPVLDYNIKCKDYGCVMVNKQ